MSYWQSISIGLSLAAQIGMVVAKYQHVPKKQVIKQILAKLQETLNEMIIE